MSKKNIIGFGKDPNEEAQIIGITGTENDQLKISNIEIYNKYYNILTELKKLNLYLSTVTDNYIKSEDIGD